MQAELLKRLNEVRRTRQAAILVTDLGNGSARLVEEASDYSRDPLAAELSARFASGKSGTFARDDGSEVFLTVHVPPARLVAIGAVHISQALVPMARIAGFDVTVIDPRTAFATPERFPDIELIAEWPDKAFERVRLDAFTALIALTHDPKIDDGPLQAGLKAGCFYVGALGSRKTHARRVERFLDAGLAKETIDTIHAPIGLDIGAQSPAEIAVSILAEIIESLRRRGTVEREAAA
jgi:xanthine dehydrogenase accessory factor